MRYLFRPEALRDIQLIQNYTAAQWGGQQAQKYLGEINRAIKRIASKPALGSVHEHPIRPYRRMNRART